MRSHYAAVSLWTLLRRACRDTQIPLSSHPTTLPSLSTLPILASSPTLCTLSTPHPCLQPGAAPLHDGAAFVSGHSNSHRALAWPLHTPSNPLSPLQPPLLFLHRHITRKAAHRDAPSSSAMARKGHHHVQDTSRTGNTGASSTSPSYTVPRTNSAILAPQLRVIQPNGKNEVLSRNAALALALAEGLDLVEVAPQINPPVCKLMSRQTFLAQQQAAAKAAEIREAEAAREADRKELHISHKISDHDLETKLRKAAEILKGGHRLALHLEFKAPGEQTDAASAADYVITRLEEVATPERPKLQIKKAYLVILRPKGPTKAELKAMSAHNGSRHDHGAGSGDSGSSAAHSSGSQQQQ